MAVDDHGLEVLKKSGEQVTPGDKSDYYIKTKDTSANALLTSIDASLNILVATNPFVSGSLASPNIVTAAGGISIGDYWNELQFVKSNGGAVVVTANPRIQASTKVGAQLRLYGTSSTDTLRLNDGNGLLLNGHATLRSGSILTLIWNSSVWVEVSRNGL